MGKRITQQARGKGSLTFRVRRRAYVYRIGYPGQQIEGTARVVKLINSPGHSAPLLKIEVLNNKEIFYIPAWNGSYEGKEIEIGGKILGFGNIMKLKEIPLGTEIFNIERKPGGGGKIVRSAGGSAIVEKKQEEKVGILMTNKKSIMLNGNCRASIGVIAGAGRKDKPIIKAGKKHHMMKAKGRKWHRTSAVKVNAVDHPFGGGRGKRIKSKIAKRNAPPGAKVGHLRPRRTGRRKK